MLEGTGRFAYTHPASRCETCIISQDALVAIHAAMFHLRQPRLSCPGFAWVYILRELFRGQRLIG